jgi:hypothetical protein
MLPCQTLVKSLKPPSSPNKVVKMVLPIWNTCGRPITTKVITMTE